MFVERRDGNFKTTFNPLGTSPSKHQQSIKVCCKGVYLLTLCRFLQHTIVGTVVVLGYSGKSGAVPQKVLVYFLFWVSPDFFPPAKKSHKTGFVWAKH